MSTTLRTSTGDIVIPRVIISDPGQVALQSIRDILALWEGEWFLDTGAGFPWLQRVLGVKNPNVTQVKGLLDHAIGFAPYVVSVSSQVFFDSRNRAFAYNFQAALNTGEVIVGGSNTPFRMQQPVGKAA